MLPIEIRLGRRPATGGAVDQRRRRRHAREHPPPERLLDRRILPLLPADVVGIRARGSVELYVAPMAERLVEGEQVAHHQVEAPAVQARSNAAMPSRPCCGTMRWMTYSPGSGAER